MSNISNYYSLAEDCRHCGKVCKKMKHRLCLIGFLCCLAGGCAWPSWLNPLSDEGEKTAAVFEPNRFLWQAAKEKLAFMGIAKENKEAGTLETQWHETDGNKEAFKIEAKVLSTQLRSYCLLVTVFKRRLSNGVWDDVEPNLRIDQEVENVILKQAKVLYRRSMALE